MAEHGAMNKPARSFARPLRDLLGKVVGETFTRQGFASAELVTRWTEDEPEAAIKYVQKILDRRFW